MSQILVPFTFRYVLFKLLEEGLGLGPKPESKQL